MKKSIHSNTFLQDSKRCSPEDFSKGYTTSGWLTMYALGCGYIEHIAFQEQIEGFPSDIIITMASNSGIGYDVRAFDHTKHERLAWDTYESLTEARRAFRLLTSKTLKEFGFNKYKLENTR